MQWDQWCRGDQSLFSWQISRSVSPGKVAKMKWRSQSYVIDFCKWWWFLFHLQSIHIMNPECPVWGIFEEPVFKEKIPGKAVMTIPYKEPDPAYCTANLQHKQKQETIKFNNTFHYHAATLSLELQSILVCSLPSPNNQCLAGPT